MTTYEKELQRIVEKRFGNLSTGKLVEKLIEMGVIDFFKCKVLSVREYVGGRQKVGVKKNDAMWEAAEKFSCSYEYVRKCMYYYNDVNVC